MPALICLGDKAKARRLLTSLPITKANKVSALILIRHGLGLNLAMGLQLLQAHVLAC